MPQSLPPAAPTILSVDEVHAAMQSGITIIDVRTLNEYELGCIPGARNIPVDDLLDYLNEIRPGGLIICICEHGGRSKRAAALLSNNGISAATMAGGMTAWRAADFDIEMPTVDQADTTCPSPRLHLS